MNFPLISRMDYVTFNTYVTLRKVGGVFLFDMRRGWEGIHLVHYVTLSLSQFIKMQFVSYLAIYFLLFNRSVIG